MGSQFVRVEAAAMPELMKLTAVQLKVYLVICSYDWEANSHGCFAKQGTIAERVGAKRQTVNECIKQLAKLGLVTKATNDSGLQTVHIVRHEAPESPSEVSATDDTCVSSSGQGCQPQVTGVSARDDRGVSHSGHIKQISEVDAGNQINEPPSDARDAEATFRADGLSDEEAPTFDEFWRVYPLQTKYGGAKMEWDKLAFDARRAALEAAEAYAAAWRHADASERKYIPSPKAWLEDMRWHDNRESWARKDNKIGMGRTEHYDAARAMIEAAVKAGKQ